MASEVLACFGCGKTTALETFKVYGPVCPECDARRIAKAVADRCAPLVSALERIRYEPSSGESQRVARAALRAHREREGRR